MTRTRNAFAPSLKLWLERGDLYIMGEGGATLLKAIDRYGSITEAAKRLGVSYKYAWDRASDIEKAVGKPILKTKIGGRRGGGAKLTETAKTLLKSFDRTKGYVKAVLKDEEYWEAIGLKISARNRFKGTVESIDKGPVTSKVKIRIQTPATITAVITKEAVDDLELKLGDEVEAVIKATEVMIAKE